MDHYHSNIVSTESTNPPTGRFSIEYKRPTAILLLAVLTLNSSPSPLFYVTCPPALILLQRHDPRLFILYTSICVSLVSFTADLWGGREITFAGIHCLLGVGTLVGSIVAHHALLTLEGRTAWGDNLLFGVIWAGCGIISRGIHFNTFTPSSARYESLRFLSRSLGDVGIDLLLAITGYTVFMILEVFFAAPNSAR